MSSGYYEKKNETSVLNLLGGCGFGLDCL
jgi:hypothetical protein